MVGSEDGSDDGVEVGSDDGVLDGAEDGNDDGVVRLWDLKTSQRREY
jgi:hypothetical protein